MSILVRAWKSAFSPFNTDFDNTRPTWDINTGRVISPLQRGKSRLDIDTALSMGAVFRSVHLLSNTVSRLEPEVYRDREQLSTPAWVARPDLEQPVSYFLEETVTSLALTGNAYWLVKRNNAGNISNIEVLNPLECVIEVDETTRKERLSYDHKYYSTKQYRHLKLFRSPHGVYGLGPIGMVRQELENALDLREYQARWFSESGVATGVLTTDQPLSEEWANMYRDRWTEAMNGWSKTAILGNNLKYQNVFLNPRDAMFIEAVQFSSQQIGRMFGIPSSLLSLALEGNSDVYSNVRDENNQFLRYTVSAYTGEIEDAFSELLPRGQRVRLNTEPLLRMNTFDRYQTYEMALSNGFMSRQEVRDREGLQGPLPALDDIAGGSNQYFSNNSNAKEQTSQQAKG